MDISRYIDTVLALPASEQQTWASATALVLAAVLLVLGLEWRHFRRLHKAGSWLALRMVSLLAAPLVVLAVLGPARAVSGMEGLAVFYGLLFTVAPLLWFGSHLGVGRRLTPAPSTGRCPLKAARPPLSWAFARTASTSPRRRLAPGCCSRCTGRTTAPRTT